MNTQPKALRLADELNAVSETGADPDVIQESAAELRRLHSVNAELIDVLIRAKDAIEALDGTTVENEKLVDDYRAAIAKAQE